MEVAIKCSRADAAETKLKDREQRFMREVSCLSKLRHPGIVQIFEYGTLPEDGTLYLVMEFVCGLTLETLIKRDAPYSFVAASDIILQVLEKSERHCLLSDPLIAYRVRPDSISFTKSLSNLKNYTQAFNNYTGFIESHIPEYFTLSQLESVHRSNFNHLVFEYCTCSLSRSQGRQETLEYLKKEADSCKEKINVNKCPFRSRAGYFLMSSFPWATAQVFKSYRWIKKIFSSIK